MQRLRDRIIICDIDGTIAILGDRDYRDMTTVANDGVNMTVRAIVRAFADDHSIVFMTGRTEDARQDTESWFKENGIPYDLLIMKSADEQLKNVQFKEMAYGRLLEANPKTKVTLALDDYSAVIEMWESKGIMTARVQ